MKFRKFRNELRGNWAIRITVGKRPNVWLDWSDHLGLKQLILATLLIAPSLPIIWPILDRKLGRKRGADWTGLIRFPSDWSPVGTNTHLFSGIRFRSRIHPAMIVTEKLAVLGRGSLSSDTRATQKRQVWTEQWGLRIEGGRRKWRHFFSLSYQRFPA